MIDYEAKWSELKTWLSENSNDVYNNVLSKMKEMEEAPLTKEEEMTTEFLNKILTSDEDPKDILLSLFGESKDTELFKDLLK